MSILAVTKLSVSCVLLSPMLDSLQILTQFPKYRMPLGHYLLFLLSPGVILLLNPEAPVYFTEFRCGAFWNGLIPFSLPLVGWLLSLLHTHAAVVLEKTAGPGSSVLLHSSDLNLLLEKIIVSSEIINAFLPA